MPTRSIRAGSVRDESGLLWSAARFSVWPARNRATHMAFGPDWVRLLGMRLLPAPAAEPGCSLERCGVAGVRPVGRGVLPDGSAGAIPVRTTSKSVSVPGRWIEPFYASFPDSLAGIGFGSARGKCRTRRGSGARSEIWGPAPSSSSGGPTPTLTRQLVRRLGCDSCIEDRSDTGCARSAHGREPDAALAKIER